MIIILIHNINENSVLSQNNYLYINKEKRLFYSLLKNVFLIVEEYK